MSVIDLFLPGSAVASLATVRYAVTGDSQPVVGGQHSVMGERVRFDILGPMRVHVGSREVSVTPMRDRILLAMLLIHASEAVPMELLVEAIWDGQLPRNARNQVQGCVVRLRSLLADAGGSRQVIVTDPAGYRMRVETDEVDLYEFRRLRDQARAAATAGHNVDASRCYREALALWRGPALVGIESVMVRRAAETLGEERARALEECLEIELAHGKASELIPELTSLVRQHPYQEKLHSTLMLALYRAGRQVDALAAYRDVRQLFHEELGTELGPELRQLHHAILNHDPRLNSPDRHTPPTSHYDDSIAEFGPAVPRTLPPDIPDFVGREKEIAHARTALAERAGEAPSVAVIAGPAGVGKTVLSVHLAHTLAATYPDGQLYVNLRGFDASSPADPFEVLGRFLRSLGVDGLATPNTLDERAELFRNLTFTRRVLVLLDNAADDDQVLPLIPSGQHCGIIINGRTRLGTAFGAEALNLSTLDDAEATELVARIAGAERAASEQETVEELVKLCGQLPLAIRIAAGRIAAKPHWTIRELVDRLRDERQRLDHLVHGKLDVRASIMLSYRDLPPQAQRLLLALGDMDLPEFGVWVSAALLDTSTALADEVLEQLLDAQLVDAAPRDGFGRRYRLHDLVRLFARERVSVEESPDSLAAAHSRAFGSCLFLVTAAYRSVFGGDYQNVIGSARRRIVDGTLAGAVAAEPLAWFGSEQPTIVAMIRRAARDDSEDASWELACTTSPLFQMRREYDDWEQALEAALAATTRAKDHRGRGAILYRMGLLYTDHTEYERAKDHFERAATLFTQQHDDHGHALTTAYLGMVERHRGNDDDALSHFRLALPILRHHHDWWGEAFVLRSIGQVHLKRADLPTADACFEQALAINRRIKSAQGLAQATFWQGMLYHRQQRTEEAEANFVQALNIARGMGDRSGQAQCLRGLSLCHQRTGRLDQAEQALSQALDLVRQPRPTLLQTEIREAIANLRRTDRDEGA